MPWAKPDERGVVNDVSAGLVSALLTISRLTFMGPEIAAVLGDQPSDGVEPRWVGQSLIPRSEGRASKTPPPAWF